MVTLSSSHVLGAYAHGCLSSCQLRELHGLTLLSPAPLLPKKSPVGIHIQDFGSGASDGDINPHTLYWLRITGASATTACFTAKTLVPVGALKAGCLTPLNSTI